ncbi:hypothetical protein H112_07579 [Trichophyton rubrum D6]|uniref:DNA-directed RNA polymerase III subunit RPC9 n=5 Tax=Trichophyton TaxID=5550 RepID=A0A178EV47_TRIRU|nr:uncharacterized protein TERG_00180 [Trichophyton rubrum CBS 118892]EZF11289.1 hypothetical protein H100_07606 [Trichophyton rubrum MR850]EZF38216.1 hypothetical protein H102_07570 [Trichophyton rubrum CBS 100081]EZF48768.1 hypothetical protein H103_07592 [Trichophyton rubrum CBS 288.86]EZF59463.1 hypothetical protein H104_07541 [Trichophyton rubrum CBS 289.86]EZF70071.1 hypothetical protein H105_07597 [Trichophyton soudanense CBS 452.61]EZF80690.1 hypothetical protein H110_07589 [Trichophy
MKILDPQAATLSNVEVLAYLKSNPPRLSAQAPLPNAKNFVPKPDLRDYNTVVKEYNDYVVRLSPHLLSYPSFTSISPENAAGDNSTTDLDVALRTLISSLKPFNLTKAEVLMIINLGVGLEAKPEGEAAEDTVMQDGDGENGDAGVDYGALALLDTIIEDREERLADEDVAEILRIVRETLVKKEPVKEEPEQTMEES